MKIARQVHPFIAAPGWCSVEPAFNAAARAVEAGASSTSSATSILAAYEKLKRELEAARPGSELRELDLLQAIGQNELLRVRFARI